MRKTFIIYAIATIGIISFIFAGCSQKESDISSREIPMQTQTTLPQTQLNAEALTPQAVTKVETMTVSKTPVAQEAPASEFTLKPATTFSRPLDAEIQTALKNAGFYTGAIDGKIGPKSQKAIEDFQKENDLAADGKVGPKTWAKLQAYLNASPAQKVGD